ncbi:MAG TPA: response regulator transcription factor [Noviherbaspirillum sp.]|nr:response regulator transcription factor [Noviherbaspirillum sp.]
MRIVVLDCDRTQTNLICQVLRAARHECHPVQTEKSALEHLQQSQCDLLIMDSAAVQHGIVEALHEFRQATSTSFPVLLLASRSEEDDVVAALAAGVNDYLIKPIRRGELLTRVQVLLKGAYPAEHAALQVQFGAYSFEEGTNRLAQDGRPIDVTQKEFELALLFFRHLGRPLSRAFIQDSVWAHEAEIPSRTIDTHVSRVRSKLGLRPENGFRLAPVYSYGYKLEQLPK